jgi:hypothetical protein
MTSSEQVPDESIATPEQALVRIQIFRAMIGWKPMVGATIEKFPQCCMQTAGETIEEMQYMIFL